VSALAFLRIVVGHIFIGLPRPVFRLETCKALASGGARVILCCRTPKMGIEAIENEIKRPGLGGYVVDAPDVVVMALDLNSLKSVKQFATTFLQQEKRLDGLILNAGIMATPTLERTENGFEKQIGKILIM
jgi:NAD(P)-dependent dehydrogenase (short-subunit alcohol dehydrogenase family)